MKRLTQGKSEAFFFSLLLYGICRKEVSEARTLLPLDREMSATQTCLTFPLWHPDIILFKFLSAGESGAASLLPLVFLCSFYLTYQPPESSALEAKLTQLSPCLEPAMTPFSF